MLRRVAATKANASNALFLITWFMGCIDIEHIHPLEGGFLRLKFRRDRRPGFPIEPIWSFYPKYFAEVASKLVRWVSIYLQAAPHLSAHQARSETATHTPTRAMTAVADDEAETHELFNTDAARAYVAQTKRLQEHSRACAMITRKTDALPVEAAE